MSETTIKVSAKSIARLAYGYELMFSTLCQIAGTSGGSPHWFTNKGQEVTARIDPLWKLNEDSNAHKPGDCLSQHQPFADWAADAEKRASALEHWRQEVGKLHSQVAAKDAEIAHLKSLNEDAHAIVARIWAIFGTPTYEELSGRTIYDLIEAAVSDAARLREVA